MRIKCEKDDILKEISIAQDIISSKNSISILSNILLSANNGKLLIKATDLKISFETSMDVDVIEEGTTTVFFDKLLGILRTIPPGEIEIIHENDTLKIKTVFKKIVFDLKTISADKFPESPSFSGSYFSVNQKDFIDMISKTVFAVSDDETRYFMNGVFMETEDSSLIMVATDGRRLSLSEKKFENIPSFSGIIIPPKVLNLVRKLLPGEGLVDVAVDERHIFIKYGSIHISSSLIDGNFPAYRRVIPEAQDYKVFVNKTELLEALKRVSLLVGKTKKIFMLIKAGFIILSSEESEIGVAREEIAAQYDGDEHTIGINYQYLMEPLKVMEGDVVEIQFTDSTKAITLKEKDNGNSFNIIMPMQL
ncbi:DNA polymerase III subunit beta [Spirochaetia bacterium 38H-sp]|uniref:Beta sliding clamp n=1 Tax=Rarispira pelagica TaxID=3141764 RepID=A0ABU9U976_9SPIR